MIFTLYYLVAAEQADEKVRKVRGMLTLEHLRVSWNKPTTPYLKFISTVMRPRLMQYPPRKILIPRPQGSVYEDPVTAWLYFDGPLSAIGAHTKVILDVPGGGFVAMDPRTHDDKLIAWAAKTGLAVLSLDYRKAPEYPFPYALDECFDVYHTIISSRGRCLGFETGQMPRIIVTGDSAGGNLATGLVLKVLMTSQPDSSRWQITDVLPPPEGLILIYPGLDMNIGSWMTDEQMALIYDRRTRKTNKNVLRRKSEDLYNLDPQTPHAFDDESAPAESIVSHEDGPRMTYDTVHGSSPELSRTISKPLLPPITKSEPGMPAQALSPDSSYVPTRSPLQRQSSNVASSKPQVLKTRLATSSLISYFADRILTPEMMRAMIILYVGPYNRPDFSTDFLLCPLHAPEALLARFPKTYFLTGERDPLVDDTVIMAGRIRQAKSNLFLARKELGLIPDKKEFDESEHVEVMLIPGISHGFFQFVAIFSEGWKHIFRCARWMEDIFDANDGTVDSPSDVRLHEGQVTDTPLNTLNGHDLSSKRHHRRVATAGSSGDEEQPLMMTQIKPTTNGQGSANGSAHSPDVEHDGNGLEKRERTNGLKPKRPSAARRMRSLVTLASEEDLLGRRMEGLAGSLMGHGDERRDGWKTP